jgi:hypothetical protein
MSDSVETPTETPKFDFTAFPDDTLFYDRRTGLERRGPKPPPPPRDPSERREKKERRKRIDPTTFEKQYTKDEMEFMTAMQHFKIRTGKAFPSHSEVLQVARSLGYQRLDTFVSPDGPEYEDSPDEPYEDRAALPMSVPFATVDAIERAS